ncbi:LysR substrate-binding domain-containing protein [Plantactinospora sp. GCM10030261]|uniref:LysR substrate-binding domain-containing protein n=1 Tax=Plantactinospora sp. GCM10030261 TaxID=3273420 RepID=UPI00360F28F8
MNLELRHLRVVCTIAEAGSVTKAASTLGLAQPALTTQLQRIERLLGGALFDRDRRGARPTALGDLVLNRARVLLPAVQGLQDEATRLAGSADTPTAYRFGVVNSPILGRLVHRLLTTDPDAQVTTQASWYVAELAQQVLSGRLDFVLCGGCGDATPAPDHGLTWQPVAVDTISVALPERHPLASLDEIDLADLADERWVSVPGDGCFTDCFATACARAGFAPQQIYETDLLGCMDLVEAGAAVAPCQASFRPMPGLVTRPLAGAPLRWRSLLGWHADAPAAADAPAVLAEARTAYADLVDGNPGYRAWLRRHPAFGADPVPA